jgi:AcrR family transcriptional regulator
VVGVFALQVVIPALVACLIGIPAGTLLSQPLLANSSHALGLAYLPSFSISLDLLVLAGGLLVVSAAAILPALRAGLLKPIAAITNATAPRGTGGRRLRALGTRLRLPRPVVLGIGEAFARPLRAILTLVTVLLGVATVVVAVGLPRSFELINNSETGAGKYQVVVSRTNAYPDAQVMSILNAQPETARVVGIDGENIVVPGITDPVNTRVFRGPSSQLGYLVIAGRWFNGPGEVLAPEGLLHDANLKIGDTFTGSLFGQSLRLRVVGEVYDISNLGHQLFTDYSTLPSNIPNSTPGQYLVTLRPGSNVDAYVQRVAAAQPDLLNVHASDTSLIGPVKIIDSVLLALAAVLVLIGVGGVFNTLLLNTRERLHDTATLKAVGMSPRQVMVMVAASAGLLALVAGVAAMPLGLFLHRVLNDVISASTGNDTPPSVYGVFGPLELIAIPVLGIVVAVAASLIPGRWAARTKTLKAAVHTVRRDAFIDVAQRLITARGYEQMSVQDVLDELEASRGAFYHYFESKEALLEAVIDRMGDSALAAVEPIVVDPALNPLQKFEAVFAGIQRFKAERKALVLAIVEVWVSDDNAIVREKWRRISVTRLAPVLAAIIREGNDRGLFRADHPEDVAKVLVMLMTGFAETATNLFLARQTNAIPVEDVERAVAVNTAAFERILGIAAGSLTLIDRPTLHFWFG